MIRLNAGGISCQCGFATNRACHPVQTYDYQTQIVFDQINDELKLTGKSKRVFVKCAASMAGKNGMYFSQHQK